MNFPGVAAASALYYNRLILRRPDGRVTSTDIGVTGFRGRAEADVDRSCAHGCR